MLCACVSTGYAAAADAVWWAAAADGRSTHGLSTQLWATRAGLLLLGAAAAAGWLRWKLTQDVTKLVHISCCTTDLWAGHVMQLTPVAEVA